MMANDMRDINEESRQLLGKQPARTLLVDLQHPSMIQTKLIDSLVEVIGNLFSVACSLGGPSRIPLFSLISIHGYTEVLLPISHVKNNYARIQSAFEDLKGICSDSVHYDEQSDKGLIVQSLQEACGQFRRQMQTNPFCYQLEVVIISCQNGNTLQKQIEKGSNCLDLEHLKKIQIVSLRTSGFDTIQLEDLDPSGSQSSLMSTSSNNSSVTAGLVDTIVLDTDPLSLQNFFNSWLLDNSTDREHMHIKLPSILQGESCLKIKCDLHDRLLNPAQLPYHCQFTVSPDSASIKTFPSTSKSLGLTVPVYRINIINLIPVPNLCDSVVFGMPMVAQATSCWKIDWDELEKNQQLFKALCHMLIEKDLAMIGQLEYTTPQKRGNKEHTEEKPQGCYIFLASSNGTLLVKSLAVRELLLPCQTGSGMEGFTEEASDNINSSLEKLEVLQTFNPLLWSSDLYRCLKLKQKKYDPLQQKRKTNNTKTSGKMNDFTEDQGSAKYYNFQPSRPPMKRSSCQPLQQIYPKNMKRTKDKSALYFPTDL